MEVGRESDTLAAQVLSYLEQLHSWDKQIQCQVLTVIVQLVSSEEVQVSLSNVYAALQAKQCACIVSHSDLTDMYTDVLGNNGVQRAVSGSCVRDSNDELILRKPTVKNGESSIVRVVAKGKA